jgi:hypothetical protein
LVASKKDRKHSGWITPRINGAPKILKEEALDLNMDFYDDWQDFRDGQRNGKDKTLIGSRSANPKQLKKHEKIRIAKKYMKNITKK